jgi:hypothetical protein
MNAADRQALVWATFEAFRSHLPKSWDQNEISRFHKMIIDLEEAYSVDLSTFRIEDAEMKPRFLGGARMGYSSRVASAAQYSDKKCDEQVARRKVDGIVFYLQNLQPATRASEGWISLTQSFADDFHLVLFTVVIHDKQLSLMLINRKPHRRVDRDIGRFRPSPP